MKLWTQYLDEESDKTSESFARPVHNDPFGVSYPGDIVSVSMVHRIVPRYAVVWLVHDDFQPGKEQESV